MLLVSGCANVAATEQPICETAFQRVIDAHADALLTANVPDDVVLTGERVVAGLDAYCTP